MKKLFIWILAFPLLVVFIFFDIIKVPILIIFMPVWILISTIDWLKGEEFCLWDFLKDAGTTGFQMCKELLGYDED